MRRTILVGIVAALFAGCGGGGGGGGSSPTGASPPGSTAFDVIASAPANGATGVARDVNPELTFSQQPDVFGATAQTLGLLGPEGNLIPFASAATGANVVLQPIAELPGGTTYKMYAGSGFKSQSGALLAAPFSASFSTTPEVWGQTSTRVATGQIASVPLATDSHGNVMAVWVTQIVPGTASLLSSIHSGSPGSWSTPVVAATSTSANGFASVSLKASATGGFVVSYLYDFGAAQVQLYDATTGQWASPVQVPSGPSNQLPQPLDAALGVDSAGNVTVVVESDFNGPVLLYASRSTAANPNVFSAPVEIDGSSLQGNTSAEALQLQVDSAGDVAVGWINALATTTPALLLARYSATTGQWSGPTPIAPVGITGQYLALSTNSAGDLVAAWSGIIPGVSNRILLAAFCPRGQNAWIDPITLDDGMGGNLNAPEDATAALDTQGFATVVWYGSNSAYQSARYSPVASAWSSPLNISPTLFAPGGAYPAPLTVDVAGNVVAILNVSETGSLNVLYATIYSATKGSWGDLVAIDPAVGGLVPQDVSASSAVDASGTVTAVWQQMVEPSTTVEFYIQSNRLN